jgi:hypothetical protein
VRSQLRVVVTSAIVAFGVSTAVGGAAPQPLASPAHGMGDARSLADLHLRLTRLEREVRQGAASQLALTARVSALARLSTRAAATARVAGQLRACVRGAFGVVVASDGRQYLTATSRDDPTSVRWVPWIDTACLSGS